MNRPSRSLLVTVAALYVASGLPFGVVYKLVPVWLKTSGVSLADIGLASLLGLPWTMKALWAPLVDRVGTAGAWIAGSLLTVGVLVALVPQLPLGVAGAASGFGAEGWGYAVWFAATFALALPAFALLPWVRRRLQEV